MLIIWDIVAVVLGGSRATESDVILSLAGKHFTLPYAWGVLGGHFFWPRKTALFGLGTREALYWLVLPSTALLAALDIFLETPPWMLALIVPLGYLVGHFIWPQQRKTN